MTDEKTAKDVIGRPIKQGDYVFYYQNIDIIKIDVEGHELEVLQGMSKMLKRDKPKIIIELLSEKDILKSDKFLKELGYKFKMRCDDRNYIYE